MSIRGRHVGEDDLVAYLQTLDDLDGAHGDSAKPDGHANGRPAAFDQLEEADGAVGLRLYRAPDVKHIMEAGQFDGAIHAEIRAGALGQLAFEFNVHRHGSVHDGRVHAHDPARNDPIPRVDRGDLATPRLVPARSTGSYSP